MNIVLSRDVFRESVFKRDRDKCVICGDVGKDAHHIIERRLWTDGGYYLYNGATLCSNCHIKAESTDISCEQIRQSAGIQQVILPDHFYNDNNYDKWGNIILETGKRLKGELFFDESVQKILAEKLHLFLDYIKYPRTYHLPWSPGISDKDKIIPSLDGFKDKLVVITEKMDGENTTMYNNHIHARSLDSKNHISRNWIKGFHAQIKQDIPKNWRFCGENMWAKHSILYQNLQSYFYLFSVWNDKNVCLNWRETLEWAELLNLKIPEIIYYGVWDESACKNIKLMDNREGYVVRTADEFSFNQFKTNVAKFVRANHVQTNQHWLNSYCEKNIIVGE